MSRRKVLIISYIWPPMEGVGLVRAFKFAKYLQQYGWEPVILTTGSPDSKGATNADLQDGIRVFRTGYTDVIADVKGALGKLVFWRKKNAGTGLPKNHDETGRGKKSGLTSIVRELIAVPDEQAGWYNFAVDSGRKIIEDHRVDIIFSTSPPETAHLVARALKRRYALPWVCDLRDLWSEDHYRERPLLKKIFLQAMEKRVLKDADTVTTVSIPWAETLRRSGVTRDRILVIENGFDEEDFKDVLYKKNKKFTITYMGKLHKIHQPVDTFFRGIAGLIEERRIDRDKINVDFYVLGYDHPDVIALARQYGLSGIVRKLERVSYPKSLEIQRSSDLLLFVQWQGKGIDGWYSAKLYDYLGARRPILALAKKGGIIEDLINRTSSGVLAESEKDLKNSISLFYDDFVKNGFVKYGGKEEELLKHTRRAGAARLADVFSSLLKEK